MHIALSTSVIQRGQTGVAQYVFALLRALQSHCDRHRFTVFVLEDDVPLFEFMREAMDLVAVPERHRPPVMNIRWHQQTLPNLLRDLEVDLLHIPSYRRMLWPRPCARVTTIHDLAPFKVRKKYDWKRMIYARLVVPWLARRQDHIIAISHNTARDIRAYLKLPSSQVTVIHNGIDHSRFRPEQGDESCHRVAQRHGIRGSYLLYVARLEHPAKNHVRLISAFEKFKGASGSDWNLVFAGSDWHGAEFIHKAIRRSRFAEDIQTLGFVADADLPDLYRASSAFVYPSLYEGFGLPPLEAMACCCPVISSDRGSLGEVLGKAALIIDPENVAQMAGEICRLANQPDLVHRLRAAGLEQARSFNWQSTAAATVKVFEAHAAAPFSGLRHRPTLDPASRVVRLS